MLIIRDPRLVRDGAPEGDQGGEKFHPAVILASPEIILAVLVKYLKLLTASRHLRQVRAGKDTGRVSLLL
jgi:hypothetical protein